MKRFIVIFTLIASIFMISIPVHAVPYIDVISQSCHVQFVYYPEGEWVEVIDSGTTSAGGVYYGSVVSATANVEQSNASIEAFVQGVEGSASAEIIFRPIGASHINIFAEAYSDMYWEDVTFIDLTTSKELLSLDSHTTYVNGQMVDSGDFSIPYYKNSFEGLFAVDSSHIYNLNAYGYGEWCVNYAGARMSLGVPEPATLLLLGSGLIGVLGLKRKFKK